MDRDLFANALTAVTDRLLALAAEDASLRHRLRQLAEAFLEVTAAPAPGELTSREAAPLVRTGEPRGAATADLRGTDAAQSAPPPAAPASPAAPVVLPELTLGRSLPDSEPVTRPVSPSWTAPADEDLSLIRSRCRLKAEGARWAATRRRMLGEGADYSTDIEPRDRDIIARARALPDCFLWMCHPAGPSPADLKQYDVIAGCFEALADILAILGEIQEQPELHAEFEQALDLLAEAQSAVRTAVASIDGAPDFDQARVFRWLKSTAHEHQVFVQRYMRTDDPADPQQWPDLSQRIENLGSLVDQTRARAKKRHKLLGKVRHKLSLIEAAPNGAIDEWRILMTTVDELVSEGLPPSNRDLRELLLPAIDDLPELEEVPAGFQLVLREIDRYLATTSPPAPPSSSHAAPETRQVAELLGGRSVVLIGGVPRPASSQALKEAFRLKELAWLESREHQSIDGFEPAIADPDVAVVLLAIRWSSHSFGDIKDFCDRHGKPLVRLPGGYNPNQVAAQILSQCSERLKA